jgi:hypothetical protein
MPVGAAEVASIKIRCYEPQRRKGRQEKQRIVMRWSVTHSVHARIEARHCNPLRSLCSLRFNDSFQVQASKIADRAGHGLTSVTKMNVTEM